MSKLVSIIIPAYNVEKYIAETINSVQKQTYPYWELLLINDGSTDYTEAKITQAAMSDSRVRLINQVNGGSSRARNTGLAQASGDYIAFLDGDDLWKATFLEEMLAAKEKSAAAIVYCGYAHLYRCGLQRGFRHSYLSGDVLLASIKGKCPIHIGCTLVDKNLYDKHDLRFTDGCLIGQDREFILKLVSIAPVASLPKELMLYRIRPGSAIRAKWQWQKHIHAIYGAQRARTAILQRLAGQDSYEEVAAAFAQRLASQWYKFLWRMIKKGYHAEALALMTDPECSAELNALDKNLLANKERFKANIVLGKNLRFWRLLSKIPVI